jgi:hypothetical protein
VEKQLLIDAVVIFPFMGAQATAAILDAGFGADTRAAEKYYAAAFVNKLLKSFDVCHFASSSPIYSKRLKRLPLRSISSFHIAAGRIHISPSP